MSVQSPPPPKKDATNLSSKAPGKPKPALISLGGLAKALGRNVLAIALFLLIAFVAIWFLTPYYVRDYINSKGSTLPDYHFHTNGVRIHLWNCSIDLEDNLLTKKSQKIPVPFFQCPRVHIAMQWMEVLHGHLRSKIRLTQPTINFVQGPTEDTTQTILAPAWVTAVEQLVPMQINQFTVTQGDVHFYDFHADPQINLEMDRIELTLDNITNSNHSKELMPSTCVLTGRPFKVGKLDAHLAVNVDIKQPTFAEKVKLEDIPAPALNAFLAKYGSVYAKSGELAFYTEMVSAKGNYNGYVKPFFKDLVFEPVPKDRGGLGALWSGVANVLKDLLENDQDQVATTIPVTGQYKDPNVDFWSAAFGLIRNAYLQALAQGFQHPELAPAPDKQQISEKAVDQAVKQAGG